MEYDSDAKIFHGDVVNTRDVFSFQGKTVDEIDNEFRASIDDYIDWCKAEGADPEKPYSGKFNLRLSPEFHKEVAITVKKLRMSINNFFEKAIKDELAIIQQ